MNGNYVSGGFISELSVGILFAAGGFSNRGFSGGGDSGGNTGGFSSASTQSTAYSPPRAPLHRTLNYRVFIGSVVMGSASWFFCSLLYKAELHKMPRCLLIGLLFLILSLAITSVAALFGNASLMSPNDVGRTPTPTPPATPLGRGARPAARRRAASGSSMTPAMRWVFAILFSVLVFGVAVLFQFLYALEAVVPSEPTSFVFAIDDSGSMVGNDPLQLRYEALKEALEGEEDSFPFAIYSFADNAILVREMAPKSDGMEDIRGNSSGGTSIRGTLQTIIDDYQAGTWDGGDAPKVVLLTDGQPTDFGSLGDISDILRQYTEAGIAISTVGLGSTDDALMEGIAHSTGGVYISVDGASMLREAMRNASFGIASRDLVSTRYAILGQTADILLGLMRLAFLVLLGFLLCVSAVMAYGGLGADFWNSVLLSFAVSVPGALEMEITTGWLHLDYRIPWFLLWLLFSMLFVWEYVSAKAFTRHSHRNLGDFSPENRQRMPSSTAINRDTRRRWKRR